jgi:hypothetical protein
VIYFSKTGFSSFRLKVWGDMSVSLCFKRRRILWAISIASARHHEQLPAAGMKVFCAARQRPSFETLKTLTLNADGRNEIEPLLDITAWLQALPPPGSKWRTFALVIDAPGQPLSVSCN